MGLSMESINQGALDIGKLVSTSMDAWDRVARSTGLAPTTVPAAAPVTPVAQTTQQSSGFALSGTTLLIGIALVALVLWRR